MIIRVTDVRNNQQLLLPVKEIYLVEEYNETTFPECSALVTLRPMIESPRYFYARETVDEIEVLIEQSIELMY